MRHIVSTLIQLATTEKPQALVSLHLVTLASHTRAGIEKALEMVETRKAEYKLAGITHYRPWIFMITDGEPTDDTTVATRSVREAEDNHRVAFFSVGVEGASMAQLAAISVRDPIKLQGLNFAELFAWLSKSLAAVATSRMGDQVALPALGWSAV